MTLRALDLFAGAGGWDLAAHALGWHVDGVEIMPEAQLTRAAAGLVTLETGPRNADGTIRSDVRDVTPAPGTYDIVIGSPPCQSFSMAGSGAGRRALDAVLTVIKSYLTSTPMTYTEASALMGDERTALVAEPLRITLTAEPMFAAWEQVPAVLPVWEAAAEVLRASGYSVATGIVNSEQHGVPQTRKRAVLVARRDGIEAALPKPTHSKFHSRNPGKLDEGVLPWVSMAQALGWGMTGRPSMTVTGGGTDTGGAEPFGNGARTSMKREMEAGNWALRSRRDSERRVVEHGERPNRAAGQPAPTFTGEAGRWSWHAVDWVLRNGNQPNAAERGSDQPAPTMAFGHNSAQVQWQQRSNYSGGSGTTAAERGRTSRDLDQPSVTLTGKPPSWAETSSDPASNAGGLRITIAEAAILQTFPPDHPFAGNKGRQYLQIGNAVPPMLAYAILSMFTEGSDMASALGKPYDDSHDQPLPHMPAAGEPFPEVPLADRLAQQEPVTAEPTTRSGGGGELPSAPGPADDGDGVPPLGPELHLPPPTDPMAAAREILTHWRQQGGGRFRYWRGEFYEWTGTHWVPVEKAVISKGLYAATERAWYLKTVKGVPEPRSWAPNRGKIGDLTHALAEGLLLHSGEEHRCIALQNGVYNLKTDKVDPHHAGRFNLSALPFAYDRDAQCPQWLAFLESVLPGDHEAHEFLAQWFGYILSGRTDQQKMLSLVGPKRCGKGTIARVLEALLGQEAVTSPTLSQLGAPFGEESLIGRKLAVMGDVRWTPQATVDATPVLLAISGEDSRDVARKNRTNWHGYLGVRFMMMSNDLPNFRDASGALAYRMMQLHFSQTFAGREDLTLTETLIGELPGIFNWAIAGLHALNRHGRFEPPASGEAIAAEVRRMASPWQAFIEDFCDLDETAETPVPELLRGYGQWCRREGRTNDKPTTSSLSRGLRTTESTIRDTGRRTLPNGQKVTVLRGIRLAVAPAWLVGDDAAEHEVLSGPAYEQPAFYGDEHGDD
jgi:P4 family phage/plasmid primase-like protien